MKAIIEKVGTINEAIAAEREACSQAIANIPRIPSSVLKHSDSNPGEAFMRGRTEGLELAENAVRGRG